MKILLYDIESAPNLSFVWDHYETTVIKHVEEWYVLCVAYMWLEDNRAKCIALPEFDSEKGMLEAMWDLFDECDIAVAHNGNSFDFKKLNSRFTYHGLGPPSPFKKVDTLLTARQKFRFNQNGLGPLNEHLGLGTKMSTGGFSLWEQCMDDTTEMTRAWKKMVRYAKRDVIELKKLYLRLRPWMDNHPNVMVATGGAGCPRCGSSRRQRRGVTTTRTMTYQQWWCKDCGAWSRSRLSEPSERPEQV